MKVKEHLEVFEECQEPGRVNTFFPVLMKMMMIIVLMMMTLV